MSANGGMLANTAGSASKTLGMWTGVFSRNGKRRCDMGMLANRSSLAIVLSLAVMTLWPGSPVQAGTLSYVYDDAGRLTEVSGAPVGRRTYQLDAAGNRTGLSLQLLGIGVGLGAAPSTPAVTSESSIAAPLSSASPGARKASAQQ